MSRAAWVVALALAACSAAVPDLLDGWPPLEAGRELPPVAEYHGEPGPQGGTVLEPASVPIEHGVSYRYVLGHCGLASPVDLDGSFWNAVDGTSSAGAPIDLETDPEMINATAGAVAVIGNEAQFRTDSGGLVRFTRHDGVKEFPGCD